MTRAMLLGELLPELEGLSADLAITGLVQDSREVKPGDALYIAPEQRVRIW